MPSPTFPEPLENPKLISIVTESYPSEGVRYLSHSLSANLVPRACFLAINCLPTGNGRLAREKLFLYCPTVLPPHVIYKRIPGLALPIGLNNLTLCPFYLPKRSYSQDCSNQDFHCRDIPTLFPQDIALTFFGNEHGIPISCIPVTSHPICYDPFSLKLFVFH